MMDQAGDGLCWRRRKFLESLFGLGGHPNGGEGLGYRSACAGSGEPLQVALPLLLGCQWPHHGNNT